MRHRCPGHRRARRTSVRATGAEGTRGRSPKIYERSSREVAVTLPARRPDALAAMLVDSMTPAEVWWARSAARYRVSSSRSTTGPQEERWPSRALDDSVGSIEGLHFAVHRTLDVHATSTTSSPLSGVRTVRANPSCARPLPGAGPPGPGALVRRQLETHTASLARIPSPRCRQESRGHQAGGFVRGWAWGGVCGSACGFECPGDEFGHDAWEIAGALVGGSLAPRSGAGR